MNGKVFAWNDPPMVNEGTDAHPNWMRHHPGEIWNCRCYAEPILARGMSMHTTDRMASGFYTVERLGARQIRHERRLPPVRGRPYRADRRAAVCRRRGSGRSPAATASSALTARRKRYSGRRPWPASKRKPVTMDHPDEFVTPDTWRQLARRHHPERAPRRRRVDGDYIVADLLITDRAAIGCRPLRSQGTGKKPLREVSWRLRRGLRTG